jgi:hypothetical protein
VNLESSNIVNVNINTLGVQGISGPSGPSGIAGPSGPIGGNLNGLISTGSADLRYYSLSTNSSGYITGFNSGIYITTGQTGQFYSYLNLLNFSNSGNVELSGTNIQIQITSIKNGTGIFIQTNNLIGLISSGSSNLTYLVTGSSGQFYLNSNPSNYITSTNLNGLGTTGSFDNRYIFSGSSGEFYKISNSLNFSSSGNVANTGNSLQNQIFGLSGQLNITGTNLQNQINIINIGTGNFISNSQTGKFYSTSNLNNFASSGDIFNRNYITGFSITGGIGRTGAFIFLAGTNITLTEQGTNTLSISSSNSNPSSSSNLNLISSNINTGIILSGSDINFYGNTSGNAPSTTIFSLPLTESVYGDTSAFLGKPNGWFQIFISGRKAVLPYFFIN